MRYKIKQWFTVLLSIVMIISMLPVTAMAESVIPTKETKIEQVQALINAMPDAEEITSDNRTEIQEEIDSIAEAMLGFTEEEAAELDTTRYDAAVAALHALDTNPVSEPSALEQVQSLIDALPDADSITEENRTDVEAQLSAIDEAKLDLTDDERSALDTTRYDSAVSALLALDGQDGDVPMPIDWVNGFEWTFDGINTVTLTGEGELNLSGQRFPFGTTKIIVNGATSIAEGCFRDWTNLLSVTLSDSVTTIGKEAFHGCTYLRQLQLPAGVTSIGESAFGSCEFLALTELPASLQVISNHAFDGCYKLALTEIPEGVTSIGGFAFDFCKSLTHLTLPASLASMDYYVFQGCENLTSLTFLGTTAPSIDSLTFANADALQEILIPAGAKGYDAPGWPQDKIKTGYKVTVNSAFGGYASASADFASAGTQINLTATPEDGYHLKEWQTVPEVEVTDNSFIMLGEDMTVTPVFEPHDFSEEWKTDADKHWHDCACGEKQDESEHTYIDGVCTTCGYSFECDIFVEIIPDGENTTLHINSTDTVRSVKEKIKVNEGIPVSMQVLKLSTGSVELEDDKCLADCGVRKDSTLHLILQYAPGGNGMADDPYLISDVEQLEAFRYYINNMVSDGGEGKFFKLTADIDLKGELWEPIGTSDTPFAGTLDGGGCTIRGLYINDSSSDNQGLFGVIGEGSTVKNLTVAGSVAGKENVGGIAGYSEGGTIEDCVNEATVTGNGNVGGIVGEYSGTGAIIACQNTGDITGENGHVGGIVGLGDEKYFTLSDCINFGNISARSTGGNVVYGGGIIGDTGFGTIENCQNKGAVYASGIGQIYIGGIAGNGFGDIFNCQNDGTVVLKTEAALGAAGGIIGWEKANIVRDQIVGCCNTGEVVSNKTSGGIAGWGNNIKNCYNTGDITGASAGGIAGNLESNTFIIRSCYNVGDIVSTDGNAGGIIGVTGSGGASNCYYLEDGVAAGLGTPKSSREFSSGEVAWLLQNGQDTSETQVWGQTVGSGTPELTDNAEKMVCKVKFVTGDNEEYDAKYTNYNGKVELPAEPTLDGTVFDHWSTVKGTSGGEKFDNTTTVTGDITVYSVGRETFGGDDGDIALTTTYGEKLTEDLSEHVAYKSGTETTGKFEYVITSGNDLLKATIEGDELKIPADANAGFYLLTIKATETEPQYSLRR